MHRRAVDAFKMTHDEAGTSQHVAAAILAYTLPGLRLFCDGQLRGRWQQIPLFLAWRDNSEQRNLRADALYSKLLGSLLNRCVCVGGFFVCGCVRACVRVRTADALYRELFSTSMHTHIYIHMLASKHRIHACIHACIPTYIHVYWQTRDA